MFLFRRTCVSPAISSADGVLQRRAANRTRLRALYFSHTPTSPTGSAPPVEVDDVRSTGGSDAGKSLLSLGRSTRSSTSRGRLSRRKERVPKAHAAFAETTRQALRHTVERTPDCHTGAIAGAVVSRAAESLASTGVEAPATPPPFVLSCTDTERSGPVARTVSAFHRHQHLVQEALTDIRTDVADFRFREAQEAKRRAAERTRLLDAFPFAVTRHTLYAPSRLDSLPRDDDVRRREALARIRFYQRLPVGPLSRAVLVSRGPLGLLLPADQVFPSIFAYQVVITKARLRCRVAELSAGLLTVDQQHGLVEQWAEDLPDRRLLAVPQGEDQPLKEPLQPPPVLTTSLLAGRGPPLSPITKAIEAMPPATLSDVPVDDDPSAMCSDPFAAPVDNTELLQADVAVQIKQWFDATAGQARGVYLELLPERSRTSPAVLAEDELPPLTAESLSLSAGERLKPRPRKSRTGAGFQSTTDPREVRAAVAALTRRFAAEVHPVIQAMVAGHPVPDDFRTVDEAENAPPWRAAPGSTHYERVEGRVVATRRPRSKTAKRPNPKPQRRLVWELRDPPPPGATYYECFLILFLYSPRVLALLFGLVAKNLADVAPTTEPSTPGTAALSPARSV